MTKPCGKFVVTGIPTTEVDGVVQAYQLQSPKTVDKVQQPDGTWTVTADFGPCADGSTPTSTKPHATTG